MFQHILARPTNGYNYYSCSTKVLLEHFARNKNHNSYLNFSMKDLPEHCFSLSVLEKQAAIVTFVIPSNHDRTLF